MAKLTRRGLIKRASIGVGATGAIAAAVTAGVHLGGTTPAGAQTTTSALGNSTEPTVVCVTNASSGTLLVTRGERAITVTNPALARSLLAL